MQKFVEIRPSEKKETFQFIHICLTHVSKVLKIIYKERRKGHLSLRIYLSHGQEKEYNRRKDIFERKNVLSLRLQWLLKI